MPTHAGELRLVFLNLKMLKPTQAGELRPMPIHADELLTWICDVVLLIQLFQLGNLLAEYLRLSCDTLPTCVFSTDC